MLLIHRRQDEGEGAGRAEAPEQNLRLRHEFRPDHLLLRRLDAVGAAGKRFRSAALRISAVFGNPQPHIGCAVLCEKPPPIGDNGGIIPQLIVDVDIEDVEIFRQVIPKDIIGKRIDRQRIDGESAVDDGNSGVAGLETEKSRLSRGGELPRRPVPITGVGFVPELPGGDLPPECLRKLLRKPVDRRQVAPVLAARNPRPRRKIVPDGGTADSGSGQQPGRQSVKFPVIDAGARLRTVLMDAFTDEIQPGQPGQPTKRRTPSSRPPGPPAVRTVSTTLSAASMQNGESGDVRRFAGSGITAKEPVP